MRAHADYVYRNRDDSLRVRLFQRETGRWDYDVFHPNGAIKTYSEGAGDDFATKRDAIAEAIYQYGKITPITVADAVADKTWYANQQRTTRAHATKKSPAQLDAEITEVLREHSFKRIASGRWIHRDVARSQGVPEDVVRRIYAAVQTAKRQGLYGGHMTDLIERSVGRKLLGNEYTVVARAKEHLGYDPPGGYGGPKPKGSAKEPPRVLLGGPRAESAAQIAARAEAVIKDVLSRRKHPTFGWDESNDGKDRALLRQAADELDVAADLYEEAGTRIRAGTLHERAKQAREGHYGVLDTYGHATKKSTLVGTAVPGKYAKYVTTPALAAIYPRDVECPRCGVGVGELCRAPKSKSGHMHHDVHVARRNVGRR